MPTLIPQQHLSTTTPQPPSTTPSRQTFTGSDKNDINEKKEKEKLWRKAQKENKEMKIIFEANLDRLKAINSVKDPNECFTIFSPPEKKQCIEQVSNLEKTFFHVADYVHVKGDTSSNMNREDGFGFIRKLTDSVCDERVVADVEYVVDRKMRKNIPIIDMTIADYEFRPRPSRSEKYNFVEEVNQKPVKESKKKTSIEALLSSLEYGFKNKSKKGWRRLELALNNKLKSCKSPKYNQQEIQQIIHDFDVMETYVTFTKDNLHLNKKKSGKFKRRKAKHNYKTLSYLLFSWGASFTTITRLKRKICKMAENNGYGDNIKESVIAYDEFHSKSKNIIDCYETAKQHFTPESMYIKNKILKEQRQIEMKDTTIQDVRRTARLEFAMMSANDKSVWAVVARSNLQRQENISQSIRTLVANNPSITYGAIAKSLGNWCSSSTIHRWITSREGYKLYTERVVPLLSQQQQEKHLLFAKHFCNNWGNGSGKYILIHYDEKWFWGLLLRKNAKTFKGVDREVSKRRYLSC